MDSTSTACAGRCGENEIHYCGVGVWLRDEADDSMMGKFKISGFAIDFARFGSTLGKASWLRREEEDFEARHCSLD